MRVIITGATGFIGQNLIKTISKKKWKISCVARNLENKFKLKKNNKNLKFFNFDIYSKKTNLFTKLGTPDILIHLAWSGLPNYQEDFHLKKNLPNEKVFLSNAINAGIKHIIVTGTCFEYGNQTGQLEEKQITRPNTKYAKAKDILRKYLEKKQKKNKFILQWIRLFYVYGSGQNPKSLFPSLKRSIKNNEKFFNIAKGKILRDFINVKDVCKFIVFLCENKNTNGVINCCSGKPISIKEFVQIYKKQKKSKIKIKFGNFKKPSYEPSIFWGSASKMISSSFKFKNKLF